MKRESGGAEKKRARGYFVSDLVENVKRHVALSQLPPGARPREQRPAQLARRVLRGRRESSH